MINIKLNKVSTLLLIFMIGVFSACEYEIINKEVQAPYTYSGQYYENLRAYKASDHQVSFMWFADYTSTQSMGTHFLGLPDSLDICSLWGGMPSDEKDKPGTFYNPKVYEEMRFVQKVKGTKMLLVLFPAIGNRPDLIAMPEDERIPAFGDELIKFMYDNDLDGIDLDYEIEGDWMHGENFVKLIKYMGKFIGPKSEDPEKIFIVDAAAIGYDPTVYHYLTYFVSQTYGNAKGKSLQSNFQDFWESGQGLRPEQFIVSENMGDFYSTGGVKFEEVDGNIYTEAGERLYSLEGMARWNPEQGKKGGFGAFYGQRDYNNAPAYRYFRKGIQIQNPAVK